MATVASEPVPLDTLVELFRGVLDDRGDWIVAPCHSPCLVERICMTLGPVDVNGLLRFVCNDGQEIPPLTRDVVGPAVWDACHAGYQRWGMNGRQRL